VVRPAQAEGIGSLRFLSLSRDAGPFSNVEALARGTHAALAAVEERRNSGFSPRY